MGKSSIAYSVCEVLSRAGSFDYIIWISAKETILTREGIKATQPELTDLNALLDKILIGSGIEKKEDFQDLEISEKLKNVYTYLAMAKFLIVIDNLETIRFENELADFIGKIPQPSKVLITTRVSKIVGEKQINVAEMTEDEAVELIREEARAVNAREITNATESNLRRISSKLGRIPLALTFLVSLSLERYSLADIENKIKDVNSTGIIDFCFSEIFKNLSKLEKDIFLSLIVLDKRDRSESIIIQINLTRMILKP